MRKGDDTREKVQPVGGDGSKDEQNLGLLAYRELDDVLERLGRGWDDVLKPVVARYQSRSHTSICGQTRPQVAAMRSIKIAPD